MTARDADARALSLARLAPSRLGPMALQRGLDDMDCVQTFLPCGGLTRRQIDDVSFAPLAGLIARLRVRLARLVPRHPPAR